MTYNEYVEKVNKLDAQVKRLKSDNFILGFKNDRYFKAGRGLLKENKKLKTRLKWFERINSILHKDIEKSNVYQERLSQTVNELLNKNEKLKAEIKRTNEKGCSTCMFRYVECVTCSQYNEYIAYKELDDA